MPSLLPRALRRSARDLPFSIFLVTVALCLFRAADLPSVEVDMGGTEFSIGPADVALATTAMLAALRLHARRLVPSPWLFTATAALVLLVVASAVPNGAGAVAAGGKLVSLAALTLGAAAFLDTRERLEALLLVLVGFCALATAWAAIGFVVDGGGRQASFMGEHDLAALATMAVVVGLAFLYTHELHPPRVALIAISTGMIGIVLGASLASLLGLYLAGLALMALAAARASLSRRAVLATLAVCAVVTAGTLGLRTGELGFVQAWFGPPADTPGEYAASWSQRLIFAYIGGRVFLDHPVMGTGWEGELRPSDYAEYLPAARERFADQPPHYFPRETGTFIPQQAYDQVLFQLGLLGAAVFLVLAALTVRRALVAARSWSRGRFDQQAYVPAGWVGSTGGALAGAALFGGSPLAALFWLTIGVAAVAPALALEADGA
jgi:hypothetical protein